METLTLWLKLIHIAAVVMWSATLLYLPGLFALFPTNGDKIAIRRARIMIRFVYIAIASPAAVIAVATGTILIYVTGQHGGWLVLKLTAVTLITLFHIGYGHLVGEVYNRPRLLSRHMHLALIAIPALLVPTVFWLVLDKPV